MSDEGSPPKRIKLDELSRTGKKKQRDRLLQSQDIQPIVLQVPQPFVDSDSSSSSLEIEGAPHPSLQARVALSDNPPPSTSTHHDSTLINNPPELSSASCNPNGTSVLVSESTEPRTSNLVQDPATASTLHLNPPASPDDNQNTSESELSSNDDLPEPSSSGNGDPLSPDSSPSEPSSSEPSSSEPSSSESTSSESTSSESTSSEPSLSDHGTDSEEDDNRFIPAEGILGNNALQNDIIIREQDDPVCPCTDITVGEVLFMSLSLGLRHVLSFNAIIDNIAMINTIFKREVIPATLYNLMKFAEPDRTQDLYHIYCPQCNTYLIGVQEKDLSREISCSCGWQIDKAMNADSYFMSLGMESQLKKLLETGDGIAESLIYRYTRRKVNENAIEDVYDGLLYKRLSAPGQPLSIPENISFSWNTDGIPYGKTSHQQIYPIYIMINELPPKLRVKNMLMVGIWVGKSKPKMEVMLQPFVDECNKLSSTGFDWQHDDETVHSRVIPICCCVDSQERYKLLNYKSFAGYDGCTFCEHPAEHVPKAGIRYGMLENPPPLRTHESMKENMLKAHEENRTVKGCKGLSPLINLDYFDLALGPVPDSLHFIEGVVQQHINNLFLKLSEDDILKMSERALKIKTPSAMTRTPRELKFREKFTASEWRSLLVVYGPVIMTGIVPDKYVSHFALLSGAMHNLLQKSIPLAQLEYCGQLLVLYCIKYEKYFGTGKMTFNVHLLLHIVNAVLNHGPVWTHTCYPFEGENKEILGWAKSPHRVAKGVARKYSMYKNLPNLASKFGVCDAVLEYCSGLFTKHLWIAVRDGNCVALGNETECQLSNDERVAVEQLHGEIHQEIVLEYQKIMVGGVTFSTENYGRSTKKRDCGVYLKDGTKCMIKKILRVPDFYQNDKIILLVQKKVVNRNALWRVGELSVRHIQIIVQDGDLVAVYPSYVGGQCVFMDVDENVMFATCLPYGCVGD